MIEDDSGSESGGEYPGNSVSGVVGRNLSSDAASAPRDTGSSSASCTSVVLF